MFKSNKFNPTPEFREVLDKIDEQELSHLAPSIAAGVLAYYVTGDDFQEFVNSLVLDGLTNGGLIELAQAALNCLVQSTPW